MSYLKIKKLNFLFLTNYMEKKGRTHLEGKKDK